MNSGIYLGMGSNLGDRFNNLSQALIMLTKLPKLVLEQESSIYETRPYALKNQPDFLNKVVMVETLYSPRELLRELLKIEEKMGRIRREKHGPRIIDIDILFYDRWIIEEEDLVVPHHDVQNRDFFLYPMLEIAPEFEHPKLGRSISDLLAELIVRNYAL
ncbi:MAG: 2-amino-4-hydroxy-6-hydroxymethyldihydropteridine diphosphokinase [Candidatus Wallbacteria bacterium]|nr:2-amino-4-hydroxy-6-hydroxymethyldihydropteridine diphosphokinase [Candidatus Wallbacteria bacterium]